MAEVESTAPEEHRGDVRSAIRAAAREIEASADAAAVMAAASSIESLADPLAMQQVVQTWLRDLGLEVRERGADAAATRAEHRAEVRTAALEDARASAERAANDGFIAKVCGYIVSGLALIAGVVGAAFSGGATLALGIAAIILVAGATTSQVLVDTGAVSAVEGGAVALGCSIAATICSFGAAAVGSVGTAITVGARIASDALSYTSASVQIVGASATCTSATHRNAADNSSATAEEAGIDRDDAYLDMDADVAGIRELMRSFARIASRLRAVRDAGHEGTRAAMLRA